MNSGEEKENNEWQIGALCTPRACKAGEGYGWFTRAYAIFKCQPASWVAIVFFMSLSSVLGSMYFQSMASDVIKVIGGLLVLMVFQILSAGLFVTAHRCEQDRYLNLSWMFLGFRQWLAFLIFSSIYSILILMIDHLCQFLLQLYGSGAVEKIMAMTQVTDIQQALTDPATQIELIIYSIVWISFVFSLAMLVGFAPALIIFHEVSPIEAIKLSVVGFVRNIKPFAVYGLLLMGASIGLSVFISLLQVLLMMLLSKAAGMALGVLLLMVALNGLLAIAWISMYTAYSDIFWLRQNEMSA
jgi:hypothetical protein